MYGLVVAVSRVRAVPAAKAFVSSEVLLLSCHVLHTNLCMLVWGALCVQNASLRLHAFASMHALLGLACTPTCVALQPFWASCCAASLGRFSIAVPACIMYYVTLLCWQFTLPCTTNRRLQGVYGCWVVLLCVGSFATGANCARLSY